MKTTRIQKILKFIETIAITLIISITAILASQALIANADNSYNPLDYQPQVQIPVSGSGLDQATTSVGSYDSKSGIMSSSLLARYIQAIYDYGMMAAGILAAIVLMGGGLLWLTSAGNDSKITQAKELISGSIIGLVILFGSWILLNTINPALLKLQVINLKVAQTAFFNLGCCVNKQTNTISNSSQKDCGSNTFYANQMFDPNTNSCQPSGCCILKITQTTTGGGSTSGSGMNNSETTVTDCMQGTANSCEAGGGNLTVSQGCLSLSACSGATIISCEDKGDGMPCGGDATGYCYNNSCQLALGVKEGDICGTKNGRCTSDANIFGCHKTNYEKDSGGRSCATGLWCCYYKAPSN